MAFMISRETENVKSSEEIESAFRALSAENKPFVTKEELYQVPTRALSLISVGISWPSQCSGSETKPFPLFPTFQNLTKEQADYCISHMKPYLDSKGRELPTSFDFVEFTRSLFVN